LLTLFGGEPRSGVKGKRSLAKRTLDVAKGRYAGTWERRRPLPWKRIFAAV